jgi:hypothetical protein
MLESLLFVAAAVIAALYFGPAVFTPLEFGCHLTQVLGSLERARLLRVPASHAVCGTWMLCRLGFE